jgi:chorismate synthase
MSGNTLGKLFCVTSFGESHGPAIGCVVDGCPPGMDLSEGDIQPELDRRKPGTSRHVTQRREEDTVEILSGVFEGKTTGTPIAMLIRNTDAKSKDYSKIKDLFRPGHADYTYLQKYGIRDYRGGGRQSARETAVRVAAAAIAKKWLRQKFGVIVHGHLVQLGPVKIPFKSWDAVHDNPFFVANAEIVPQLEDFMDRLRKSGDSCGALIAAVAQNVPVGWGEPVYDKLDADLAYNMMSINAVKGVEIGAGFRAVEQKGTEHSDEMTPEGFLSNNAGGILGGISTGQNIVVRVAIKPTSSIRLPRRTIDVKGQPTVIETHGRHDPCVGIRATPICEAMMALTLMDHALRHRAQNADVECATPRVPAQAPDAVIEKLRSAAAVENPDPDEA